MSGIRYLLYIKWKAFLRNIFSKPVPAAFTILGLVVLGAAAVFAAVFGSRADLVSGIGNLETFLMGILGYIGMLLVVIVLQKRTAMVERTDAFYLFAGPFSRRQVLAYILFDMTRGCIVYAGMASFVVCIVEACLKSPFSVLVWSSVGIFFLFYIILAGSSLCYLLEITGHRGKWIKVIFTGMILASAGALLMMNAAEQGNRFQEGLNAFVTDRRFFLVPVFGWLKYLMMSSAQGNMAGVLFGFSALFSLSLVVTVCFLTVKGDYCERAVEDAEWFSQMRENLKSGNDATLTKVRRRKTGEVRWREGALAVMSKTLLQMRKTNSWIRKQELFLIIFYLALARFSHMPYTTFQSFILIVVFIAVSSDSMKAELKMHYIYMIPDKPVKKVLSIAAPALLKTGIIVTCAVVPAAIVYRMPLWNAVFSLVTLWGYGAVFVAGNLWSIKVLKSGNNSVAEQFMKMLIILFGCLPAIAVTVLLSVVIQSPELFVKLVGAVTASLNLAVGLIFIMMAKGMFEGKYGMLR